MISTVNNNNNNEMKNVRFCELVDVYPIQNYKLSLSQKEKTLVWYRPEELTLLTTTLKINKKATISIRREYFSNDSRGSRTACTSHRQQSSSRRSDAKVMITIKEAIAAKRRQHRNSLQRKYTK
jgi:hypothetical protein